MIRRSRSHPGDVSGSKSDNSKENFEVLLTIVFDELKSTNNLLELVNPAVLETLCEDTHAALNDINWEAILTGTNCRNIVGKNTEYLLADRKLSPSTENFNTANSKTVINESKSKNSAKEKEKSPKAKKRITLDVKDVVNKTTLNTTKGEESSTLGLEYTTGKLANKPEYNTTLIEASNEAKSTKNCLDGQDDSLENVKPSTSTKFLNKSTNKTGRNKSKSKTDLTCKIEPISASEDVTVESTLNTKKKKKKKKKESPHRQTRSATKRALFRRELKTAKTDFPINKLDWYYKDEQNFKKEFADALECFSIWKEVRRQGNLRLYYTYMLFDLRMLEDVTNITLDNFIDAMFYVGKGIGKRAFQHTKESKNSPTEKKKCMRINKIWDSGKPVRVLFGKEKIKAEEAYTREAAMIDVIGLKRLCNKQRGTYYDEIAKWDARKCYQLGVTQLVEALEIFKRNDKKYIEDVYRDGKPPIVKIE